MHGEASEMAAERGRKVRLIGLRHLDNRTRSSRRARKLAAAFEREIGGDLSDLTEAQRIACARAATLVVISEDAEARRLRGEPVSLDDIVRTTRIARLAVKDVLNMRLRKAAAPGPLDALVPQQHGGDDDD
jgi:hypothetical protein